MEIKQLWYRMVAGGLLKTIDRMQAILYESYDIQKNLNKKISKLKLEINVEKASVQEWKERAMTENKDAAIAIQVVKERMRGGETKCVLGAHEMGSKMRIRELEDEVEHLRETIKALW